ncbi:FtsK/SpoIIIE family DNA translocase [Paraherbaspirillum soli]|uniref:DNA translocase FtsK n=1 Tax=Paraherbaspirillum soli TaxID=631222 RepID=A0ABW0MA36_9BURK
MHIAVFDWFGWSLLWLTPLLWRVIKARRAGVTTLRGPGSIRLWLGTLLILLASSALEAAIRMTDATPLSGDFAGQAVARALIGGFGQVGGVLTMMAVVMLALSWLFGTGWLKPIAWLATPLRGIFPKQTDNSAPQREQRTTRIVAPIQSGTASARPREIIAAPPRKRKSWRLPSAADQVAFSDNPQKPRQTRPEAKPSGRTMSEWAVFEQIIPTPAMRARANAAQAARNSAATRPGGMLPYQSNQAQPRHAQTRTISTRPAALPANSVASPALPIKLAAVTDHQASDATIALAALPLPPEILPMAPTISPALLTPVDTFADTTHLLNQAPASLPAWTIDDAPDTVIDISGLISLRPVGGQAAPAASEHPRHPAAQQIKTEDQFQFHAPHQLSIDLPGLDLLDPAVNEIIDIPAERLAETGVLIEQRLKEFKVPVTVLGADAGPVITRFEVEPALGVRGSQIVGLMKDLSRALGLTSIRVVETIPGKTCMGLELPNEKRQMIRLSEILESDAYQHSASRLTLALGKDITGNPIVADLARAPHMLVAGTTGSGKSVAINAMILSLLYKSTPEDVRLIMIDPKMLELSVYEGIPHLLAPVVTDMKLASNALTWCVAEMDKRYRLMSALGVRNLAGFNQKIRDGQMRGKKVTNPFSLTPDAPEPLSTLPLIVVIIDELADLMMVTGKKIEELIARLAQKARAAGIHLILATQRPSVDVITGLIKANIPTRVAFQVSSKIDSRTILDQMGAEALLGHGDMLFLPPGSGYPQRVHGAFVSDEEVHRVVEHLKQFGEPEYEEAILAGAPAENAGAEPTAESQDAEADPLYDEAVAFVLRTRRASISSVQRQLRVGYNRAARLVEQMEAAGIVSSVATNGSREVLAPAQVE